LLISPTFQQDFLDVSTALRRALARFFVPGKYPIHTISDMVLSSGSTRHLGDISAMFDLRWGTLLPTPENCRAGARAASV
jgi:hypothetical protein